MIAVLDDVGMTKATFYGGYDVDILFVGQCYGSFVFVLCLFTELEPSTLEGLKAVINTFLIIFRCIFRRFFLSFP